MHADVGRQAVTQLRRHRVEVGALAQLDQAQMDLVEGPAAIKARKRLVAHHDQAGLEPRSDGELADDGQVARADTR